MKRVIRASYDANKVRAEVDQYLADNPSYSVDPLFGDIRADDTRFQDIFNELKILGYHPKQTYSQSRMYTCDTITIDIPYETGNQLPAEVDEVVNSYPNVIIWDAVGHLTRNKVRKLKLNLRDAQVRSIIR